MNRVNIGYSNLGDITENEANEYISYCNEIAEGINLGIKFELSNDNASPGEDAEHISNHVWNNCDWWTNNEELRAREIKEAIDYFS